MAEYNLEKDPLTGKELNRLADYNNSEPVSPVIKPMTEFFSRYTPTEGLEGGTGDTNFVDYTESKYDNQIFTNELSNLEHLRSRNQGSLDMLGRATANFVGKTAVNVVGGTLGTAYGAAKAIADGKISSLWDNDLTTALDNASDSIREYFKVYNSNDFNERNLIARSVLNPIQFTDELLDTLSFTSGAILTEMLTSGIASSYLVPRALKYFKNLNKTSEASDIANTLGSTLNQFTRGLGEAGTLSRQLATGAAYEASIEARQATLELREKMHSDWVQDNPGMSIEDMPDDVREDIDRRLSDAGLFTFLTNVALVGASNIIQFPKVFSSNYKTNSSFVDRIKNNGKEYYDSLSQLSKGQRLGRNLTIIGKNPFMEGIVEEGGQSVLSNTATLFFDRKNDPEAKDAVTSFLESFGKSLIDTYTTAEGWEEIGMGMIVGSIGAPGRGLMSLAGRNTSLGEQGFNEDGTRREFWTGGILGNFQEENQKTQEIASVIEDLNNNTSLIDSMKANYDFLVQSKSLDSDMEKYLNVGDVFNYRNRHDDKTHAYIMSRLKAGLSSDLQTQIEDLQRMDADTFYSEFRGIEKSENTSEQDKLKFKVDHIEAFKNKVEATQKAYDLISNSPLISGNEDLQEFLTHSLSIASYLDIRENQINNQLASTTNGLINNLSLRSSTVIPMSKEIASLKLLLGNKTIDKATKDSAKLYLEALERVDKEYLNLTSSEYNDLRKFSEKNPVLFNRSIDDVVSMLNDSRDIRDYRHNLLNTFNTYFTEEGVIKFEEARAKQEKIDRENQLKQEEESRKRQREEEKASNLEESKEKQREVSENKELDKSIEDTQESDSEDIIENIQDNIEESLEETELDRESEETLVKHEVEKEDIELIEDNIEISNLNESQEEKLIKQLQDNVIGRKRSYGNVISYSAVNKDMESSYSGSGIFSQYKDKHDSEGNIIINPFVDKRLFSNKYFKQGDSFTLKVPSYQEMVNRGIEKYTLNDYNNNLNDIESFPIGVYSSDNVLVGYVPTKENVVRNVNKDYVVDETKENIKLRTLVFNNKEYVFNGTIGSKTAGNPMFNLNSKPILEALGDGNNLSNDISIAISKTVAGAESAGLFINNSTNGEFLKALTIDRKFLSSGNLFAIVPSAKEGTYMPIPLDINPIGIENSSALVEAIRLFATKNKTDQDKAVLRNITEYNLNTLKGIRDLLENSIFSKSKGSNDSNTLRITEDRLILSPTNPELQFNLSDIVNNEETRNTLNTILSNRFPTIKLNNLNKKDEFISYKLENDKLTEVVYNNFLDYASSNNLISSNIERVKLDDGSYGYAAQSVIELSDVTKGDEIITNEITDINSIIEDIERRREEEVREAAKQVYETGHYKGVQYLSWINVRDELIKKYDEEIESVKSKISTKPNTNSFDLNIPKSVETILNNSSKFKLNPKGDKYIDTSTGVEYNRVTTFISDELPKKDNKLVQSSLAIGTKVDSLIRDFFNNNLKDLKEYTDLSSLLDLANFINNLNDFKEDLDSKGITIIADEIVLSDFNSKTAGTVDLIGYDGQGNIYIYDIKTMRGNQFNTRYSGDEVSKYESNSYGKSNQEKHTNQLSSYSIMYENTTGIKPKEIGIIPIEISYNAGDTSTNILKLLPFKKLNIKKEVLVGNVLKDKVSVNKIEVTSSGNIESNKPKKTLGLNIKKLKGKDLDFNISPDYIVKNEINSIDEFKKRCF